MTLAMRAGGADGARARPKRLPPGPAWPSPGSGSMDTQASREPGGKRNSLSQPPSLSLMESELSPKGFSHHPICSS